MRGDEKDPAMITNIDKERYDSYRFSENIHFFFDILVANKRIYGILRRKE